MCRMSIRRVSYSRKVNNFVGMYYTIGVQRTANDILA